MKKHLLLLTVALLMVFSGCKFISNSVTYPRLSREFSEALIHGDYDKCISLMDVQDTNHLFLDTLKTRLAGFHDVVISNFGDNLDYTFMQSQKNFSTVKAEQSKTTRILMQIRNKKDFGVLRVFFDDATGKIADVNVIDKEPIPSMTLFWLFGVLPLSVLAFNIYMIIRVKRSKLKRKWLQYLLIIILNVPALTYRPIGGISLQLFDNQIFLGMSVSFLGYLGSAWTLGIPLGSLFALWQLFRRKKVEEMTTKARI